MSEDLNMEFSPMDGFLQKDGDSSVSFLSIACTILVGPSVVSFDNVSIIWIVTETFKSRISKEVCGCNIILLWMKNNSVCGLWKR